MVHVKLIRDTFGGLKYLENAITYPMRQKPDDSDKLCGIGGYGVDPMHLDLAYRQMHRIKACYGKTSGNPLIHFMISLDKNTKTAKNTCDIADKIARFYMGRFQVLWCVHQKARLDSDFHIHVFINSVSYVNGLMFHSGFSELNYLKKYIENLTKQTVFLHYKENG